MFPRVSTDATGIPKSDEFLRLEEENQRLRSQLRDMSHETRGDTQPISTSAQELEILAHELALINVPMSINQQLKIVDRMKKITHAINDSISDILQSTSTFLDLDKYEHGEMPFEHHPLNLYRFMKKIIQIYSPYFDDEHPLEAKETDVVFELDIDDKELWIMSDARALKHIFKNFISNAQKFTEYGSITFSAKILSRDDNNCKLSISISDSGCGMSDTARYKLLHDTSTYTQVHNALQTDKNGSGRGFKLARRIINEYLKGTLTVEPNKKRLGLNNPGSTFSVEAEFKIPSAQQILEAIPTPTITPKDTPKITPKATPRALTRTLESSSRASNPPQYRAHFLLVDDNKVSLKSEAKVIEMLGYSCDTAVNGKDAVEKYQLNTKKYQIIIMDMCMPDEKDGIEATQKIREFEIELGLPLCPIIGLSGLTDPAVKETALQAGMTEYLLKPIQANELGPVIEKLLLPAKPTQTLVIPQSLFGAKIINHHVSLSVYPSPSSSKDSDSDIESHADSTTAVTTAATKQNAKLFQPQSRQESQSQPKKQIKPSTNTTNCLGKCFIM